MSEFNHLLQQALTQQLFRPLDLQFARLVAGEAHPARLLLAACLSASSGEGHVCLPLQLLNPEALWQGKSRQLAEQLWAVAQAPSTAEQWQGLLSDWPALDDGSQQSTPMVLNEQRLYLHRLYDHQQRVAAFFSRPEATMPVLATTQIRQVLDQLFGTETLNWQKVAAAVALTRRCSVISGGPGTGKTTTVARLLAALLQLNPQRLRIQMAAPTGKAAARLTESLASALAQLPISEMLRSRFPHEAVTLHRLLGAQAETRRLRYHRGNPLHLDLLIVDEASMVDLALMASLIEALPDHARVIFLGDRDQLNSVEAGSVLGDLCRCADYGYSLAQAQALSELTGCQITGREVETAPAFRDNLCLLQQSYRFNEQSGIGQLAKAVNLGDVKQIKQVFAAAYQDIAFYPLDSGTAWQTMLSQVAAAYAPMVKLVKQQAPAQQVLRAFSDFQLLCALREGPFGVNGLNRSIEQTLHRYCGLKSEPQQRWYAGRPILITRNDRTLGLFNGDIGITLLDENQQLKVFFPLANGELLAVQPSRLPLHETVWAMTVHKSQGSEFTHTALILPAQYSPILTRELVYTAITRARQRLTLYSDPQIFYRATASRTQRRSGLTEALTLVSSNNVKAKLK